MYNHVNKNKNKELLKYFFSPNRLNYTNPYSKYNISNPYATVRDKSRTNKTK